MKSFDPTKIKRIFFWSGVFASLVFYLQTGRPYLRERKRRILEEESKAILKQRGI